MKAEIIEHKDKNLQVRVKFAANVFKKCFEKAEIEFSGPKTKRYAPRLEQALSKFAETLPENLTSPNDSLIRAKVSKIFGPITGNEAVEFRSGTLAIFLKFGGFDSELKMLEDWKSVYFPEHDTPEPLANSTIKASRLDSINVLYTPKAFGTFSLMRTIIAGKLIKTTQGWEYSDAEEHFSGNIEQVEFFTMPGEKKPLWLKVYFTDQDTDAQRIAYFAEGHSVPQISVSRESDLYGFLSNFFAG